MDLAFEHLVFEAAGQMKTTDQFCQPWQRYALVFECHLEAPGEQRVFD